MLPRRLTHVPRPLRALVVAIAVAACTDREVPTAATSPAQHASAAAEGTVIAAAMSANPVLTVVSGNVTITQGRGLAMYTVVVDPGSAAQASAPVTWSTSNPAVATVSSTGHVRGVTAGTATITARAMQNQLVATSVVTVAPRPNCSLPATSNIAPGEVVPLPSGYEDAPHIFRVTNNEQDFCKRYAFTIRELPVSGSLYQVADDGRPQMNAKLSVGMSVSNSEGWLAYVPGPNYHGTDSFRYTSRDGGGRSYGFFVPAPIRLLPVNDPPTVFPATHPGDNITVMTNVLLDAIDIDSFTPDVCVSTLPRDGDLYWGFVAPANLVAKGECRSMKSLRYVSRIDAVFGCGSLPARNSYPHTDSFQWHASDGNAISETVTGVVRIDYVTQPPDYNGPVSVSTSEDSPVDFTLSAVDPDGDQFLFVITSFPRHGTLWRTDVGPVPVQMINLPSLLPANPVGTRSLQFVPDPDFNTLSQQDEFTLQLADTYVNRNCDYTVRLNVSPMNDAPKIVGPDRISALVGLGGIPQTTAVYGFGVTDDARPADVLRITLRAQGAAAASVGIVDPTGFAVQRVSATEIWFEGTLARITALLNRGVEWTPNASGEAYGELAIIVNDLGNHGPGGPLSGTKIVAVDVGFESDGLEDKVSAPRNRGRSKSAKKTTRGQP